MLSTMASWSYSLPVDRNQPIHITADSARMNEMTGVTTYKGKVIITQGTMLIEGARVDVYQAEEGIDKIIVKGSPAHFKQKINPDEPYSDAWGNNMLYEEETRKLTITNNGKVVQGHDTFTGERIVYSLDSSIVDVFGTASDNPSDSKEPTRVNVVIQPKKTTEANTP